MRSVLVAIGLIVLVSTARATLAVLPDSVSLTHAGQNHQLLAVELRDAQVASDHTAQVTWRSGNPAVVTVGPDGVVTAVGDGETTIAAESNGESVSTKIVVTGTGMPFAYSFRNHVEPLLFKMGCNTGPCHGAQSGKNGFKLSLRGFDPAWDHNVITRQANARRVSLAQPADSLLLLKATMGVAHGGGERFGAESEAYKIMLGWIQDGAPPAHDDDPQVVDIEVFPKAMTLAPGAEQRLVVRARYSNGETEDVSHWAKYATTQEAVAAVDELGRIKVLAPGSGAITVWYASKLASVDVTVPRGEVVEPKVFAESPRNNLIDELVLKKLQALQVPVAGQADDATFIRRAFLDAAGILPKPEEVAAFRADAARDKRATLVDALLARGEYVDYWTYKWSDLFLVSANTIRTGEEVNSFYRFIRESVEKNKPWDQFARDIITAKGNTLENGAGAYFLMHKEITDLTETTAQAFLGTSITCARCHNHPLEKWTQDDYYGMANLLSRVKLKNGREDNSTEVQAADFGEAVHPRLGVPMKPKPLDGEALALDAAGDRREYLAKWLTAPTNPYFARAIVNRVWKNFMGTGLVEAEDDLRLTNPATNEELLNALAKDLCDHGFDLKHLMRTIMNSAAYQRSSDPVDAKLPDTRYYSQYIVKRLPAEVILDAYAQISGVPTPFGGYPDGTRALQLRDTSQAAYFLTAFGRPARKQTCACERTADATIAQTLHLANGDTLNNKLKGDRSILKDWAETGISDYDAVNRLFMLALSRYPRAEEADAAVAALTPERVPSDPVVAKAEHREALEDLAWALLSSKEFLFNH